MSDWTQILSLQRETVYAIIRLSGEAVCDDLLIIFSKCAILKLLHKHKKPFSAVESQIWN